MPQQAIVIWSKPGASFTDAEAAYANKNSQVPVDQMQLLDSFYATMLSEGILLQPITKTWNVQQCLLSIEKNVTDAAVFDSRKTYSESAVHSAAAAAGWTLVDYIVTEL